MQDGMLKELEKVLALEDKYQVRAWFVRIVDDDPTDSGQRLVKAFEHVQKEMPKVLEEFDEDLPLKARAVWDEDYWHLAKQGLQQNFCRERLEHVIKVGRTVFDRPEPTSSDDNALRRIAIGGTAAGLVLLALLIWLLKGK